MWIAAARRPGLDSDYARSVEATKVNLAAKRIQGEYLPRAVDIKQSEESDERVAHL